MSTIALSNSVSKRRAKQRNRKLERFFLIVIVVLSVALVVELVFHLVIAPKMKLSNIEVTVGNGLPITKKEILSIAGLTGNEYLFSLNLSMVQARLAAYPLIKSAEVQKVFPNTLKIVVHERTPLALSLVEVNGRMIPVAFDEDGVVFQIGQSVTDTDLPVVSGLKFQNVQLGARINPALVPFLVDLSKLRENSPLLFSLISEVKFVTKNRSGFEVLLYPRGYHVRIRLGTSLDVQTMKKILLVLDVLKKEGDVGKLEEIDFRTDEVVARPKEG